MRPELAVILRLCSFDLTKLYFRLFRNLVVSRQHTAFQACQLTLARSCNLLSVSKVRCFIRSVRRQVHIDTAPYSVPGKYRLPRCLPRFILFIAEDQTFCVLAHVHKFFQTSFRIKDSVLRFLPSHHPASIIILFKSGGISRRVCDNNAVFIIQHLFHVFPHI